MYKDVEALNKRGDNYMSLSKVVKVALQFFKEKGSEPFTLDELIRYVKDRCGTTRIDLRRDLQDWFWLLVDLDLIQSVEGDKFFIK